MHYLSIVAALLLATLATSCSTNVDLGEGGDGGPGSDARVQAGSYDECGNGMDDDADGSIDEGCPCGLGETQSCFSGAYPFRQIGICTDGVQACEMGRGVEFGTWGACNADQVPGEQLCDGNDGDCDGAIDEGCPCTAGETRQCADEFAIAPCRGGVQTCGADGAWSACEGALGPSAEICEDQIDNDCDGQADEGCDCSPTPEVCGDGMDNDCDGEADEGCVACTDEPAMLLDLGSRYAVTMAREGNFIYFVSKRDGGAFPTQLERLDLADMSRTVMHTGEAFPSLDAVDIRDGRLCVLMAYGAEVFCGPTGGPYTSMVTADSRRIRGISVDGEGVLWLDFTTYSREGWALQRTTSEGTTEIYRGVPNRSIRGMVRSENNTVLVADGRLSGDGTDEMVWEIDLSSGEAVERLRSGPVPTVGSCRYGGAFRALTMHNGSFAVSEMYSTLGGSLDEGCPFDLGTRIRTPEGDILEVPERRHYAWQLSTAQNLYGWSGVRPVGDFSGTEDFMLSRIPVDGSPEVVIHRWARSETIAPPYSFQGSPVVVGDCAIAPVVRHASAGTLGLGGVVSGELWTFRVQ